MSLGNRISILRISSIPLSTLGTTGLRLCFFVDDIVMLASLSQDFQCALGQFAGECEADESLHRVQGHGS